MVGTQTGGRDSALPLSFPHWMFIYWVAVYSGILLLVVVEVFFFFLNGVRVSKWTIKDNFATRIWRSHSSTLHIALYPPFYIPHFTFSLQHDLYCVTSELRLSSKVWCRSQYRAARRTHVWFWSGLSMCCCGFQLCLKAPLGFSISYFSKTWKIRFVFSLPAVILKLKGIL